MPNNNLFCDFILLTEEAEENTLWQCSACHKVFQGRSPLGRRCPAKHRVSTPTTIDSVETTLSLLQRIDEVNAAVKAQHLELEEASTDLGLPGLWARSQNYLLALRRYLKAGRPKRAKEQGEFLNQICSTCPNYVPTVYGGTGGCSLCGCPTSADRWPARSKTLMATEDCPARGPGVELGYWRNAVPKDQWGDFWFINS